MDTVKVAKKGIKWTTLSTVTTAVVGMLRLAILTRFLEKSDFGVVSIVTLVIGLTQTFSNLGFAAAIMHKQDLSRREFSSLYWIQLSIYLLLYFIIVLFVKPIASFYNEEQLTILLPIALLDLIFWGIGRLYGTLLQKNLQFKTIAIRNIVSASISLLLAVGLAIMGAGVYSLLLSTLFHTFLSNLWNYIAGQNNIRIQLVYDIKGNISLIKIGLYQTGSQILDYMAGKMDVLLIGRFLGMEVLGIYSLAKELLVKLISVINSIAVNVTTPLFSLSQDNKKKLSNMYCETIHYLTLVTFPIVMSITVLAHPIVSILYGDSFYDTATIIILLTAWTIEVCVHNPIGGLVIATGRTDLSFYYTLIRILLNTIAVLITVNFSINAVALGQSINSIVIFFLLFHMVIYKITGTSLNRFIQSFVKQGIICISIGIPFSIVVNNNMFGLYYNPILHLIVYGICLLLLLGILEYIFNKNEFLSLLKINSR